MHDFVIPDGCFWEDVRKAPIDKKNETLDKAVGTIADQNIDQNGKYILKGIINTVRWNEPAPDGSGGKKLDPEVLSNLISYLGAVDLSNKNVTVDVLGDEERFGREMNVVKDVSFEGRILEMTQKAIAFVDTQIKEYTFLGEDALFSTLLSVGRS